MAATPFPQSVKDAAYKRAGGKCECKRSVCGHTGRCNKSLVIGWHAHHINSNGPATLSNCEALCIDCHQNTRSYGRR